MCWYSLALYLQSEQFLITRVIMLRTRESSDMKDNFLVRIWDLYKRLCQLRNSERVWSKLINQIRLDLSNGKNQMNRSRYGKNRGRTKRSIEFRNLISDTSSINKWPEKHMYVGCSNWARIGKIGEKESLLRTIFTSDRAQDLRGESSVTLNECQL
jgi:hypothetical protein